MIESRKPAAQPHGPQVEIGQRQGDPGMTPDHAGTQQHQPEGGVGGLALGEHRFGHFTQQGQAYPRGVVALHLEERFDQLALVDAHQLPRLPLIKPDADITERLKRGAEPALRPPSPARHPAQPSRGASQETDQAVRLSERVAAKDDSLRFPQWHRVSARRPRGAGISGNSSDRLESNLLTTASMSKQLLNTRRNVYRRTRSRTGERFRFVPGVGQPENDSRLGPSIGQRASQQLLPRAVGAGGIRLRRYVNSG